MVQPAAPATCNDDEPTTSPLRLGHSMPYDCERPLRPHATKKAKQKPKEDEKTKVREERNKYPYLFNPHTSTSNHPQPHIHIPPLHTGPSMARTPTFFTPALLTILLAFDSFSMFSAWKASGRSVRTFLYPAPAPSPRVVPV